MGLNFTQCRLNIVNKNDFRKSCIKRLKCSCKFAKLKKDKQICIELAKLIDKINPKRVLLYIPLGIEVNVLPLINKLRQSKRVEVYVPFMEGQSFRAVKYRLPLKTKKFGIKEPKFSTFTGKIDLTIVPVVGVDGEFKRIGFGKGMYDRYFGSLKYRPTIVFTQISLCITSKTLSDKYDIKADYIITS